MDAVTQADHAGTDPAFAAARAAVLAEVAAGGRNPAPSLRPLTLNTALSLYQPSAALTAKVDARVQAGYRPEGHDYPASGAWARVVIPAVAVAAVDVPPLAITAILAGFDVDYAWWFFLASLIVFAAATVIALAASRRAMRDPLRLTRDERRALNQSRRWQSRQPWIGPPSTTPEYRLVVVAHDTVSRLVTSPAWASRYLDEHRVRLNLALELDGIDEQAYRLAALRAAGGPGSALEQAWNALVDRAARLRHYAEGVLALNTRVLQLDAEARTARLDAHLAALTVGSALDQFAAEHVRSLSADLHKLAVTNFAPSPENAK
jgi:hypothetical protein